MKTLILILTILLSGWTSYAQCNLPLEKAPKLGGAFLGMTVDQAIARFGRPFSREKDYLGFMPSVPMKDSDGEVRIHNATNFEGIDQLSLDLVGDKVSAIMIHYPLKAVKWDSNKEFAEALSEKLNLPDAWTYQKGKARLECGTFSILAEASVNRIYLSDMSPIRQKVDDDKKAAEEKKKAFKP